MLDDLLTNEVLRGLPIFAGMDDAERRQLIGIATAVEFEPQQVVMRQGETSQELLVVLEGECHVVKQTGGNPSCHAVLAELKPHDHFGEMSFFHAAPHSASVQAQTHLRLLRFARADYDRLADEGSLAAFKLAYNILGELAARLRRMDEWVTDLLCKEPPEKQASEWSHFRDKLFDEGWGV